jgi:hypothetical protein
VLGAGYSSTPDITQYTALAETFYTVIAFTIGSTSNPFVVKSEQSIIVFAIVAAWIFILVFGTMFFRRWDIIDGLVLLYCPDESLIKKQGAVPTIGHLKGTE